MYTLRVPIAFIIFNRPDTTEKVFAEIAKAKPKKLFVVADGPRINRPEEVEKVAATRAIIERIDWDCEVLKNFSDVNLGCRVRLSTGLDWVFSQVEEAIILEDDCLPGTSFFQFCDEMIERFRHEKSIGMIGGVNFQKKQEVICASYYFSKYVHIWGWATWSDRWLNCYDVSIKLWPKQKESNQLAQIVPSAIERKYWTKIFDRVYQNRVDTWDYQWVFANWVLGRVNILPSVNLISNIGFGRVDATHTKSSSNVGNMPTIKLEFPLKHPAIIEIDKDADEYSYRHCFHVPIYKKLAEKILYLITAFFSNEKK